MSPYVFLNSRPAWWECSFLSWSAHNEPAEHHADYQPPHCAFDNWIAVAWMNLGKQAEGNAKTG
jgi:hypothetical protein